MQEMLIAHQPEGFMGEKKTFEADPWPVLYAAYQNGLIMQHEVTGLEKHRIGDKETPCWVLMFGGLVKGLVPFGESGLEKEIHLNSYIGKVIAFRVKGIDRENNLAVLSRKEALEKMAGKTWKEIGKGKRVTATARAVLSYGAYLDIGGVTAWLPAREMSWGYVADARQKIKPGDSFDVEIQEINEETGRVTVSLRALLPDPWAVVPLKYRQFGKYVGTVTGWTEYGIFVNLEEGVDALAPRPLFVPGIGERVVVIIKKIDSEKRRIKCAIVKSA